MNYLRVLNKATYLMKLEDILKPYNKKISLNAEVKFCGSNSAIRNKYNT